MTGIAILIAITSIITTILWLVIGWRAMRAHERLAENASLFLYEFKTNHSQERKNEEEQKKLYHKFLRVEKGAADLPFSERKDAFKMWLLKQ